MPSLLTALLATIVAGSPIAPVEAPRPDGTNYVALGREVAQIVRGRFYDSAAAKQWYQQNQDYSNWVVGRSTRVITRSEFTKRTNKVLAQLGASHTAYYTPLDVWYYRIQAVFDRNATDTSVQYESIGADFAQLKEGWFIRRVFTDSPAQKAGLVRGDEVISADGYPFDPVLSFREKAKQPVVLKIRRSKDGPTQLITVTPHRIHPRLEWRHAQAQGTRIIESKGQRVLVVPYFAGAGDEFREMIADTFSRTGFIFDAVVLDCRDGLGGTQPDFLNLFNQNVPRLEFQSGDGSWHELQSPSWPGPLVLVINAGTRSGKEMVAASIKRTGRGTLVGERTAGAVLGAQKVDLSDGSILYLAVANVKVDGVRLEGVGVEPDVPVADPLPYAAGADPQLERAITIAAELVDGDISDRTP